MKVPASSESRGCLSWTPRWYLCPAVASSQGRRQRAEWGIGIVTWKRLEGADLHPWILSWGLQSLPWGLCFIVSHVLKDHPLIEAYWHLRSNIKIGGIWNGWQQLLVSVPWCGCLFVIIVFSALYLQFFVFCLCRSFPYFFTSLQHHIFYWGSKRARLHPAAVVQQLPSLPLLSSLFSAPLPNSVLHLQVFP